MTMQNIPANRLPKQHHRDIGYCSNFGLESRLEGYEYKSNSNTTTTDQSCLGSEHHHHLHNLVVGDPMAEDESRTNSLNEGAGSSSKGTTAAGQDHNHDHPHDEITDDKEWLRLSIGARNNGNNKNKKEDRAADQSAGPGSRPAAERLVELDLLPPAGTSSSQVVLQHHQQQASSNLSPIFYMAPEIRDPRTININTASSATTNYYNYNYNYPAPFQHGQHLYQHHQHHHQVGNSSTKYFGHHQQGEINWAFRPSIQYDIQGGVPTSSSSTTSSFFPMGSYLSRPFQLVHPAGINNNYINISGQSSDIRVIDPPRRPHSGIWFMLQASESQGKEPFLPQIPKSYMRIKDGRMTVRLLMKYLANKLRLDSESEIEITCRGQQLLPFFTLQHVRDSIWSNNNSRDALTTLLPDSPTTDHLMLFQYARTP